MPTNTLDPAEERIEVRDKRNIGVLFIDHILVDLFLGMIGANAFAVYFAILRGYDNQECEESLGLNEARIASGKKALHKYGLLEPGSDKPADLRAAMDHCYAKGYIE